MILTEKETNAIEDLKTQEQACIEKYTKYSNQAKDPVLKELFEEIARDEQKHFDSLDQVIKGKVPSVDCNDSKGKNYNPAATYDSLGNSEDKKADCYLATDCIGTEKLVSGEYNSDVFVFGNSDIRKLLADIQIEEQNHAEMLWKYKTAHSLEERPPRDQPMAGLSRNAHILFCYSQACLYPLPTGYLQSLHTSDIRQHTFDNLH